MNIAVNVTDEPRDPAEEANARQYLTFMLGSEEYGVDILRVQEIKGWARCTPIPNTPEYILGVINLRGTIVPIVDLRRRFHLPAAEFGPTTVVIVVKVVAGERERTVGLVADAVSEVYSIGPSAMRSAPEFGCAVDMDFVAGLASFDERMVILLDVDRLVASEVVDSAHDAGAGGG